MTTIVSILLITFVAGAIFWAWFSYLNARKWQEFSAHAIVAGSFRTNAVLSGALALVSSFVAAEIAIPEAAPAIADSDAYGAAMAAIVATITLPPALLAYESYAAMMHERSARGWQWAIAPLGTAAAVFGLLAFIAAATRPPDPPPPAFKYSNPLAPAELCAGEPLEIGYTIESLGLINTTEIRQNIRDRFGRKVAEYPFEIQDGAQAGEPLALRITSTVQIPNLAPGAYVYGRIARSDVVVDEYTGDSDRVITAIAHPFSVVDCG